MLKVFHKQTEVQMQKPNTFHLTNINFILQDIFTI